MPYATLADLQNRYGEDAITVLADRDGDGAADAGVVDRALADADAEIDAYLAERYQLPLSPVPPLLTRLACEIAVYRLGMEAGGGLTEEKRKRYEDVVALLKRLGDGTATLGLPADQPAAPRRTTPGLVSGNQRIFGRRL